MNQLTNLKQIKALEHISVRIENCEPRTGNKIQYFNLRTEIQGWYHQHGLKPSASVSHWKKLTELFRCKPNYYPVYECKNALWAFEWKGNPVLFYKDSRGISIQVLPEYPVKEIIPLYEELIIRLKGEIQ